MHFNKLNISLQKYTYGFTSIMLSLYNFLLCTKVYDITNSVFATIYIFICIFLAYNAIFSLIFWRKITKPITFLLIFLNAFAAYFMITYNTAVDYVILLNIVHTDLREIISLLNPNMLICFIFMCALPSVLVIKLNIIYPDIKKQIRQKILHVVINLTLLLMLILPISKKADDFYREQKQLRYYLLPTNYVGATISLFKRNQFSLHGRVSIADDIQINKYWQNDKKNVVVFVVGETARAANFSLGSYERDTNEPLLPYQEDFAYYSNFYACGTATAISVPCMFSPYNQENYEIGTELYTDNLANVMEKAGYKAFWRENNTGCENNCKRIETEKKCQKKHCLDTILLENLEHKITSVGKDVFMVLHQRGSHGPDYYKMYPPEFEKYQPVCKDNILSRCSFQELVNVFDNTIVYTSHFLAQTMQKLKKLSVKYNIMLIYASDHGESLGEDGLYLHSAVYRTAPDEQKHIPALIWIPKSTQKDLKIDMTCLKERAVQDYSHDNIFHTILGFIGASTKAYDEKYDILKPCSLAR